jgi:phosphatidate cytidylyltransferase
VKERIISGACIGVILVISLLLGGWVLWGILLAISLIGFFELARATGVHKEGTIISLQELAAYVLIVELYLALKFTVSMSNYIVSVMLLIIAMFFLYVIFFPRIHSREVADIVFCFIYAPCMLSFIYLLWELPFGNYFVWLPFIAWICDTCAYFTGVALGRHKMTPLLSPKKTIEGAIGGTIGATIAGGCFGIALGHAMDNYHMIWVMLVIAALGSIVTQLGDLVASGIKRDHGIKDFGKLIPGHGGIMDRFDSVLIAAPIVYFLVLVMQAMLS